MNRFILIAISAATLIANANAHETATVIEESKVFTTVGDAERAHRLVSVAT